MRAASDNHTCRGSTFPNSGEKSYKRKPGTHGMQADARALTHGLPRKGAFRGSLLPHFK